MYENPAIQVGRPGDVPSQALAHRAPKAPRVLGSHGYSVGNDIHH